jgi:ankyrin repeat protein
MPNEQHYLSPELITLVSLGNLDALKEREKDVLAVLELRDKEGLNLFHWAAKKAQKAVFTWLYEIAPEEKRHGLLIQETNTENGNTVLQCAAIGGNAAIFELVLEGMESQEERYAQIEKRNKEGLTILHIAAAYRQHHLFDTIKTLCKTPATFERMLTEKNANGFTLLHVAAHMGHTEMVKTLLAAARTEESRQRMLAEKNVDGFTPLHVAAQVGHTEAVKALLAAASTEDIKTRMLTEKAAQGFTALHLAAWNGHTEALKALLDAASTEDIKTRMLTEKAAQGSTALHIAAQSGHAEALKALLAAAPNDEIKKSMLTEKAARGFTALHLAAWNGHTEALKALLDAASTEDIKTRMLTEKAAQGFTALHIAASRHNVIPTGKNTPVEGFYKVLEVYEQFPGFTPQQKQQMQPTINYLKECVQTNQEVQARPLFTNIAQPAPVPPRPALAPAAAPQAVPPARGARTNWKKQCGELTQENAALKGQVAQLQKQLQEAQREIEALRNRNPITAPDSSAKRQKIQEHAPSEVIDLTKPDHELEQRGNRAEEDIRSMSEGSFAKKELQKRSLTNGRDPSSKRQNIRE